MHTPNVGDIIRIKGYYSHKDTRLWAVPHRKHLNFVTKVIDIRTIGPISSLSTRQRLNLSYDSLVCGVEFNGDYIFVPVGKVEVLFST